MDDEQSQNSLCIAVLKTTCPLASSPILRRDGIVYNQDRAEALVSIKNTKCLRGLEIIQFLVVFISV